MNSFGKWLEQQLKIRGWRAAELARKAGIAEPTLSRLINDSRKAGTQVCTAIATAFDIAPVYVFRKAGLLPPAPEGVVSPTVDEVVQLLSQLPEEEQVYVVRMLQGLVATKGSAVDDG